MLRKPLLLGILLLLAGGTYAYSQGNSLFTSEESAFIESCDANFATKTNSPEKATECLDKLGADNYSLFDRLRQDSEVKASRLLTRLIAIKDLGDFMNTVQDKHMRSGLVVRLERDPCILCTMELGPQPEKLYPWLNTYRASRLPAVKEAGLDWDTLSPEDRQYIGLFARKTREQWLELTITGRKRALTPEGPALSASTSSAANMTDKSEKYSRFGSAFNPSAAGGQAPGVALGQTFDNSNLSGAAPTGGAATKFDPSLYVLTDAQAASLGPRLVQAYMAPGGELSGTRVGDELKAFSRTPGGAIDLSVASFSDGTNGDYSSRTGKIRISRQLVEKAMINYGITAAQLTDANNADALQKISRYTAPVFVHEYGGHQMQADWARKNGISDLYYMDMETDAFSKQSLFVIQKLGAERLAGNTSYNVQVPAQDIALARKFRKEGFAGVSRAVMYYEVPSRDGRAAMNFANFEEVKKELTLRLEASKADPAAEAARDAARPQGRKTADLEAYYNSIYPWYKLTIQKAAEDNAYYQAALIELDK